VLEVDERTPPIVVPEGAGFRLERFPLGTEIGYAPEPLPGLDDVGEAISAALDLPLDSAPLGELLRPGMRLTIAFDDITTPTPRMRQPDIRGRIIEGVLSRAAAAGVDDVALVSAIGLNRRNTAAELEQVLGERVFRSFYADGLLTQSDAEDGDRLTTVATGDPVDVTINARAAASDLLVFVHLAASPGTGGAVAIGAGLGSTTTISALSATPTAATNATANQVKTAVENAVATFSIEAVLDNRAYPAPLELLGKREWEWGPRDRARWWGLRRALALSPAKTRRRLLTSAPVEYSLIGVHGGAPAAVAAESDALVRRQRLVEMQGQADVGVVGVSDLNPYSVGSVANPILAAWQGLTAAAVTTDRPFVRRGGALLLYSPLTADFSALHHPSYVDFFADVLTTTTDPVQIQDKFEARFATDPWYTHLYRTSNAFHGIHPFHRWYEIAAARNHYSDIVFIGADRSTVERLGFRAASTLADALEIVSANVGRSPSIRYLHTPPSIIAEVR
jgi:hypothetical protein